MPKIEKLLVLIFYAVLVVFMVPAILPMIVGEAAWILTPVLIIFLIAFPIMLIWSKDE
jgi:hypothetical protein